MGKRYAVLEGWERGTAKSAGDELHGGALHLVNLLDRSLQTIGLVPEGGGVVVRARVDAGNNELSRELSADALRAGDGACDPSDCLCGLRNGGGDVLVEAKNQVEGDTKEDNVVGDRDGNGVEEDGRWGRSA